MTGVLIKDILHIKEDLNIEVDLHIEEVKNRGININGVDML